MPYSSSPGRRFLALACIAVVAACSARSGSPAIPGSMPNALRFMASSASPSPTSSATSSPTHYPHAACGVRAGYKSPFHEPLRVQTAFGQLEQDAQGNRSAFEGVDLASARGRVVHAAQAGHVAYYFKFGTFGKSAIVTAKGGEQTLYTPLEWTKPPKARKVEAGAPIGVSDGTTLHFEATDGSGLRGGPKAQLNPCGDTDGASGTIGAIGITAAISVTFSALGLDGTTIQQSSTGIVTPATLSVTQVVPTHVPTYAPYEYSPTDGSYYVVLCGNVVFASGPARYAGPIPFVPNAPTPGPSPTGSASASPSASPSATPSPESHPRKTPTPSPTPSPTASPSPSPPAIPNLVFFRDAGAYGSELTSALPVYGNPCPAPAPPSGGGFFPVFDWIGQTAWGFWWNTGSSGETMAMAVASPGVAVVNPSAPPVLPAETSLPYPPPPADIFTITAVGVGTTTIANTNSGCACTASPIPVTVKATPSAAPVPPPIPNATSSP